jgi:hypothetical protein
MPSMDKVRHANFDSGGSGSAVAAAIAAGSALKNGCDAASESDKPVAAALKVLVLTLSTDLL